METFYYSIKTANKSWNETKQHEIEFDSWENFGKFCNGLSKHLKKEIRGCETSGYNNQGSYFYKFWT
jgi:hypothetical protein